MSQWANKYVIGLTGNIGTGKSVVRRMLEHLGALGIDADSLGHRAIARGAPGYAPVVRAFGQWVVGADGEIDRARLGRLVFSDQQALALLESIVHPLVIQAIDWIITHSSKAVVVVEAVKLLEANIHKSCDSIWVVTVSPEVQLARLVQKRKLDESVARQRIQAQPPQRTKVAAADVVIHNAGSFEDTWKQVSAAWRAHVPQAEVAPVHEAVTTANNLTVFRARPRDAALIAELMNRVKKESQVTKDEIMAAFADKAFLLLRSGERLVGVAGWQVENLVSRTTEILLDPQVAVAQALPILVEEMERASKDLQCEASLVFLSSNSSNEPLWRGMGYQRRTPETLAAPVWQEMAQETFRPGQVLYFKQLRHDRVLRPI